jgi:hypothetical protein
MVHTVLPALIPDIRKIYDAYFASFDNERMGNIMLKIIFPDGVESEEFRAAHAAGTLDWWNKSDTQYTYKCVDMDTGEIVGMGLVDIYIKPRTEEERKNGGVPWLTGEHQERAEKVLNPLWEAREKLFGGQPYICELHPKITAVLFDAVTDSKYFQTPMSLASRPNTRARRPAPPWSRLASTSATAPGCPCTLKPRHPRSACTRSLATRG